MAGYWLGVAVCGWVCAGGFWVGSGQLWLFVGWVTVLVITLKYTKELLMA